MSGIYLVHQVIIINIYIESYWRKESLNSRRSISLRTFSCLRTAARCYNHVSPSGFIQYTLPSWTGSPKTFMLVPKLLFGYALVKEALLRFLHAISSIPDLQFPVLLLHQEYLKRQNCISNTEAIRQVIFSKELGQEWNPKTPQKGYETEFHVQERSQTGVWARAGNLCFRTSWGLGSEKKW